MEPQGGETSSKTGDEMNSASAAETPRLFSSYRDFYTKVRERASRLRLPGGSPRSSRVGIVVLALVLICAGAGAFLLREHGIERGAITQYTRVYSFVPEKISKSAAIPVSLPEGVTAEIAKTHITFEPTIDGVWQDMSPEGVLIYEPRETLREGTYYAVTLDTGTVRMSGDFLVDQDPQIEAIFPREGTETHEDSEITIVFNRPMVPLTTLTTQEAIEVPVEISPETPGRFKWISTRNLQFIPDTTLRPASNYTVEVNEGLVSIDGLKVAPRTATFMTRQLRYESLSEDRIGYRSPFTIAFNQPVDREATEKKIRVTDRNGNNVGVTVEYGERSYYDRKEKKEVTEEDQSTLFIYQRRDQHGREKVWDFDATYTLTIDGAVPLYGTNELKEGRSVTVTVPSIVESVTAQSVRSDQVRPDLFDPEGTITITFYDDVVADRSHFKAKGLREVRHGERCVTDAYGEPIGRGSSCTKESDPRTVIFSFDARAFEPGESLNLALDNVVTVDGFRANAKSIDVPLRVYPRLEILSTNPRDATSEASLDGMYVCTNTPLRDPGEGGLKSYISADAYIVYGRFQRSWYVSDIYQGVRCNKGEFQTELRYGLHPETRYQLKLGLSDEFGQQVARDIAFVTGKPSEEYTRLQNLQQQYNVTTPNKTKLVYAAENLDYVNMHICRLTAEAFLRRIADRPSENEPPSNTGCSQVITQRIALPPRYFVNNYFTIDLRDHFTDPRGQYEITLSHPRYLGYNKQPTFDRTYVSVTNLAVGKKEVVNYDQRWSASNNPAKDRVFDASLTRAHNIYWVNNSTTLAPATGATVVQYEGTSDSYGQGIDTDIRTISSGVTDLAGIARTGVHKNIIGAVVTVGDESAVVVDWADTLGYAGSASDASRTYLYTDRPIYRPTHTVNIRGIDRIGFDGSYEIWNKDPVPLSIFDARGIEIYTTELAVGAYGTFNAAFTLPPDASLGTYRIEAFGQSAYFDVEEYAPAAFRLEVASDKEEYTNGDTITLDIDANYYFGVPVDEGTVSYTATAQDYYFDRYEDEFFNFGGGWYYCYYCGYGDEYLFRGETTIDEDGHAVISREFDIANYAEKPDEEGGKLLTFTLTAKDINGRSVSAQKSFIVHRGEFYLGGKTDQYYTGVKTPLVVRAKTVDQKGNPLPIRGIEKTVNRITYETFKRQEVDGGFYYRSERKETPLGSETIATDGTGNYQGAVTFDVAGEYEIVFTVKDGRGNTLRTVVPVYIHGEEASAVPQNNNYELELEVQKPSVNVGDTASVLIKSPYKNAKALIAVERGTILDYWVVPITGGLYLHEFPVKSTYTPNFYVSAMLLSPDPEVKYGIARFEVGRSEQELTVEVTPSKQQYLPGEKVTLEVKTTNAQGVPVPAEVSVAVADLSVLALKGNPKKNPLVFFYDGFPLAVTTASNIKNVLHEVDVPLGTKGGGGASPDDLAGKKRGDFRDTAFWSAGVVTDGNGRASVTFTLPDNLTTWQIESLGVTKDTKLGVSYREITSKKDLMAVPERPRFVVPGDRFSFGATIYNQTDRDQTIRVRVESVTLQLPDAQEETVKVSSGESRLVYFDAVAPETLRRGVHTFTLTAEADGYRDSVDQTIPITPNETFETAATANFTKEDTATEFVYVPEEVVSGKGGLTINANATLAVFLSDALTYMAQYPYGCSEQLASALSSIGIVKAALDLPNVEGDLETLSFDDVTYNIDAAVTEGLANIYAAQHADGSFSYYPGLEADLSLSIHVVRALDDLRRAGFAVREDVLARGAAYIAAAARAEYYQRPTESYGTVISAELSLRRIAPDTRTPLTDIVKAIIADEAFLNEKIDSGTLAELAILTAKGYGTTDRARVYKALENRIDIDGRGAYLKSQGNRFEYRESATRNTALLLAAFTAHEDEHAMLGNTLRWLLASRDSEGAWGGTYNTYAVVGAMIDYLRWQHETESEFTLRGIIDGVTRFEHVFSPKNIFATFSQFVPIDELPREKLVPVVFERTNAKDTSSNFYYDMSLRYFLPVESLPPRDEGVTVTRSLYPLGEDVTPVTTARVGEVLRGKLTLTIPRAYTHMAVEDMIPAGFEVVNFNLATEDQSLNRERESDEDACYDCSYDFEARGSDAGFLANAFSAMNNLFGTDTGTRGFGSKRERAQTLYPTHTESHDDRIFLYIDDVEPGVYEYEYFIRAIVPGEFRHLPARAEELYFPEVFGRTSGDIFRVTPR